MGSILKQTEWIPLPNGGLGEIAQLVQIVQLRNSCANFEFLDTEGPPQSNIVHLKSPQCEQNWPSIANSVQCHFLSDPGPKNCPPTIFLLNWTTLGKYVCGFVIIFYSPPPKFMTRKIFEEKRRNIGAVLEKSYCVIVWEIHLD